ncbi:putative oxidoreductase [Arthrobacter globiformis NBRC 12137]|uniref:Putative oxidoreductase n=1 Tax=Arthrobacter globiformis (strain ATCC 8010 / DSM 20124 / JCM 1332 / NBRC 12137 / NCIMB 8907 / NRRL B-2979 / 168) TaxID=1077972 RepID=H0QRX4_ARTG1|nr:NAD(P)-binding domain-containing protein [Arthrobacter globiformis]GAB15460.1 putative oxidoreductase [Arthrobacter globiformis NBRC 12137]
MRIAVLGTGMVGRTLAGKLVESGHDVVLGSRSATNEAAVRWAAEAGPRARAATFFDAAAEAEVVINATPGTVSLEVLAAAGTKNLAGKVLIDVANPLDASAGFPPSLTISNTDSLAETIQRTFPTARVVKALNTMRADVMVAPEQLAGGDHDVFMAGDNAEAKEVVAGLLREFGWRPEHIRDLGPLEAARGLEMWLPLWLRIFLKQGNSVFNIKVVSE